MAKNHTDPNEADELSNLTRIIADNVFRLAREKPLTKESLAEAYCEDVRHKLIRDVIGKFAHLDTPLGLKILILCLVWADNAPATIRDAAFWMATQLKRPQAEATVRLAFNDLEGLGLVNSSTVISVTTRGRKPAEYTLTAKGIEFLFSVTTLSPDTLDSLIGLSSGRGKRDVAAG